MTVGPVSAMEQDRVIYRDEGGELHQLYNEKPAVNVLMWHPKGGQPETVHDFSSVYGASPDAFYREGDQFSGYTGSPEGGLTYHLFTRNEGRWKEAIKSPMGSIMVIFKYQEWISTRKIKTYDRQGKLQEFVVTDIPLTPMFPDSNATLILRNGRPYHPQGEERGGAIWDQPLEKILADHEARLKAARVKEPQNSAVKPTGKTPASEKVGEAIGKKILLPVSGQDAERGTALYWAVGGGVAAVFILAFWMRKAGMAQKG
ncbi:hypothetical protein GCM10023213_19500 [Prosthecobacter algae]|uniref:Uncharacterized protein n=2 Tax=Prosthecobacter algae TaxID=1144682 RepID=A0ABP9P4T8_9BACT